ncbi:MAG: hypothetical protein OQJ97_05935 [Rhodospirillales bacterium]|nr:hypothetical protein [Rhodospirillales bacterium]
MSKIKIKAGEIEIEYEGDESLTKDDLVDLISKVSDLHKAIPQSPAPTPPTSNNIAAPNQEQGTVTSIPQMTTKVVASKLSVKTGTDLAFAAAAKLGYIDGKPTFTKQEILDQMKSVKAVFTQNMRKNLTPSLNTLLKNNLLNESAEHIFSLTLNGENKVSTALG